MKRITFSPLPDGRHEVLRPALESSGLPASDLGEPGRAFFELADAAGPIGFVGLEGSGPHRLLRSLVVLAGRKRQGFGGLLVARAEAVARDEGVEHMHLLTTTAAEFFVSRGYKPAARSDAPGAIMATAQFGSLCPSSATYLVKRLR